MYKQVIICLVKFSAIFFGLVEIPTNTIYSVKKLLDVRLRFRLRDSVAISFNQFI